MNLVDLQMLLKYILLVSVLFVWIVRYENIVLEFKSYRLPDWLRDFVGICKITCVVLINFGTPNLVKVGTVALALLMTAAFLVHIKVKNNAFKMIPSFALGSICVLLFLNA